MIQQINMTLTKLTKNMVRYDAAEGQMAYVDNVYVSKFAFPAGAPQEIVVTILARE